MIRYVKAAAQRAAWVAVESDPGTPPPRTHTTHYGDRDTAFVTVLGVDQDLSSLAEDVEREDLVRYQGPFYIDIDSTDITESIEAARAALEALQGVDVDLECIRVWATGKKGFHIEVPQEVFAAGEPVLKLPRIYARMAEALNLPLYDRSVYSMGKGRMWRVENVARPDNDQFKVPITAEEALELDEAQYQQLCSMPRELPPPKAPRPAPSMKALFESCRMKVEQEPKFEPQTRPEGGLFKVLEGAVPACMQMAREGKKARNKTWNDLATQYVQGLAEMDRDPSELIEAFVTGTQSKSYPTVADRRREVKKKYFHIRRIGQYAFACVKMRSVLASNPCEGCPVKAQSESASGNIVARHAGYFEVTPNGGLRQLTNFTLEPVEETVERGEIFGLRRTSLQVHVVMEDGSRHRTEIPEAAWISRARFADAFLGISNAYITASDNDIQRLKGLVLLPVQEEQQTAANRIVRTERTEQIGIHIRPVGDEDYEAIYVEPGWSTDKYGMETGLECKTRDHPHPRLKSVAMANPLPEEYAGLVRRLLGVNVPHVIAPALGWTVASALKSHLMTRTNSFPLLNLWGRAGAGKTETAQLLLLLHGIDHFTEWEKTAASASSYYALWRNLASSTTVPRIIDEVNRSKIPAKQWLQMQETLKACWNADPIQRGTLSRVNDGRSHHGVNLMRARLTAPVIYLSEQSPDLPALKERTVAVGISTAEREMLPNSERDFFWCVQHKRKFNTLAKALYIAALNTSPDEVHAIVDSYYTRVPPEFKSRQRLSYQIVLAGLEWLSATLDVFGVRVGRELEELRESFVTWLSVHSTVVAGAAHRSEVDALMQNLMAMLRTTDAGGREWLVMGHHYAYDHRYLYLDAALVFAQAAKYYGHILRQTLVFESAPRMVELFRQERYCVGYDARSPVFPGRDVLKLDLMVMAASGININYIRTETEETL